MFKYLINLLLIIIIIFLGFYYPKKNHDGLKDYINSYVTLSGWVCRENDNGIYKQRLVLCVEEIKKGREYKKVKGKVLIITSLYPSYNYGDYLIVNTFLKAPKKFKGFSYDNYLSLHDIYSLSYYPKITKYFYPLSWRQRCSKKIFRYKRKIKGIIEHNLPEPESGLALAMLLGYKRLVIRDDVNMFSRLGLSHIIAISGMHIVIISSLIIALMGKKAGKYLVFIFLILYPIFIGFKSSAIRASLLGLFGFLGENKKRKNILFFLLLSASIMLIFNSKLLQYDLGFQLSFLAILGIIYIFPIVNRILFKGKRTGIKDIITITLAVQLAVLPILLINFHQLSLISPLSNLLILCFLPFLLSSLIIAIILSFLIPFLSLYFFYLPYTLLHFIFIISHYLSLIPWASISINNFTWKEGIIYYIVLLLLIKVIQKPLSRSGL